MKKMKNRLLFVAFLLAILQGVSCRGVSRLGIPQDENSRLTDAGEQDWSLKPEHIAVDGGSPVNEANEDINRRSQGSSALPNTGKPTGFSQLLPNENGLPRGIPVSPQTFAESTRFAQLPQNLKELKEFPVEYPGENNERKFLSAPTKLPVQEKISTKNKDSYVQEDVAVVSQKATTSNKTADNYDLQSRSVYLNDVDTPASQHGEDTGIHRLLSRVKDLESGAERSGAAIDTPAAKEDDTIQNRFQPKASDSMFDESDKTEEVREMRPIDSEEIPSDEVLIPPTTNSARFSPRGRFRLRRRKRSREEEDEDARRSSRYRLINFNRENDCFNELSRTGYVILAITGWLVAAITMFICCFKFGWICRKRCGNDALEEEDSRFKSHSEDLESGQIDQTIGNEKEISMYEKHDRRPTGYCNVETIDEESSTSFPLTVTEPVTESVTIIIEKEIVKEDLTRNAPSAEAMTVAMEVEKVAKEEEIITVKESIEENCSIILPPLPPPMPSIKTVEKEDENVSTKTTTKKVRFQGDVACVWGQSQRRASEKIKVIRKLSSSIRRPSLLEEIGIAKDVIMDIRWESTKGHEKRKVIKETTANERRGSLLEEIQFAKNVILPADDDKERDEGAFNRRHMIKQRSSSRRTSLLDNITMAMEVLSGNIETVV